MATGIPITYVPARNTVFLSLALAYAEVLGAADIFIGVNAVDYSGYPDCRPEYIAAFERMANLATKAGVEGTAEVHDPHAADPLTKAEIIRRGTRIGRRLRPDAQLLRSRSAGAACGRCDACLLRLKGFAEAGLADPVPYRTMKIAEIFRACKAKAFYRRRERLRARQRLQLALLVLRHALRLVDARGRRPVGRRNPGAGRRARLRATWCSPAASRCCLPS